MIGVTAIARNYLAHARVLADSFRSAHRRDRFVVLCVDAAPGELADEPFEVITGEELVGPVELARRGYIYSTQELVSSMKSEVLAHLVATHREPVVFIDADGCLYGALRDVARLARRHGIVLSPHRPAPAPTSDNDADYRAEAMIVQAGVFNAGFLAVGPRAAPFLEWWRRRTARHCIGDIGAGFLMCQTWLGLVPGLFSHYVLADPGLNLMGWNLAGRDIGWRGSTPMIGDRPLRHFHFCARFDPHNPDRLSPHGDTFPGWPETLDGFPGLTRLAREYAERLLAAGHDAMKAVPPVHAHHPDGSPIDPAERRAYRVALIEAESTGGTVTLPGHG